MIVMKFGGTSIQDKAAIRRAIRAVSKRLNETPIVILSAMGKTTNKFLEIAQSASEGHLERAEQIHAEVRNHHLAQARNLLSTSLRSETGEQVCQYFDQISNIMQGLFLLGECTARSKDAIASFGERLSSLIFAGAMREKGCAVALLDSREMIRTDHRFTAANVLPEISVEAIREKVTPAVREGKVVILQGFIGSTLDGVTTTIGRGGSDFTASLVGAALEVEDIQIWTDVPGILTADPRIVSKPFKITSVSFAEASELAYFGSKVLHPSTLLPAITRNIPIHVCSSYKIDQPGTFIAAHSIPSKTPVKSIACKKGITIVNIHSTRMLLAYGFLRHIFEVFDRHQTMVDVVSTSEVSVSLTIDSTAALEAIVTDLEAFGKVEVEPHMAIICTVGDNLRYQSGIAARIFGAMKTINIHMISQGASEINVTFLVHEKEMEEAVRRLHDEFFREPDPELFEPC